MLIATALALVAANSALAPLYHRFLDFPLATTTVQSAVKDVLMVLFFFTVGMELKSEMVEGVLTDHRQILLPLLAALGGMVVPALLFLAVNHAIPAHLNGWAIPTATDIAFALCILTLAGKNTPPALKIFLLAIAIFDDLGAIAIIAFFYSHGLAALPLLLAAAILLALYALNRLRVTAITPYLALGIALWFCLHHGGIHPTIGGVLTGLAIPLHDARGRSPLNRCLYALHPWVSFAVLPLFAFTAAGIDFSGFALVTLTAPLTLGVICGLFLGKQMGIFGTSWLLIRLRIARLPHGTYWRQLYAVSILAGIGFTMSLFIDSLAFTDPVLSAQAKLGVIVGSTLAALAGMVGLRCATPRRAG